MRPGAGPRGAAGLRRRPCSTPFFRQYGNNSWAIFKAYLDAASDRIAAPVTARYLGTLAGADVFTADNASVMFQALRADHGVLGPFADHP